MAWNPEQEIGSQGLGGLGVAQVSIGLKLQGEAIIASKGRRDTEKYRKKNVETTIGLLSNSFAEEIEAC